MNMDDNCNLGINMSSLKTYDWMPGQLKDVDNRNKPNIASNMMSLSSLISPSLRYDSKKNIFDINQSDTSSGFSIEITNTFDVVINQDNESYTIFSLTKNNYNVKINEGDLVTNEYWKDYAAYKTGKFDSTYDTLWMWCENNQYCCDKDGKMRFFFDKFGVLHVECNLRTNDSNSTALYNMNFSILNSKYLNNNQIDSNNNYNYFQSNYNMYNNKYPWHRIGDSTSLENIYLSKCYQKNYEPTSINISNTSPSKSVISAVIKTDQSSEGFNNIEGFNNVESIFKKFGNLINNIIQKPKSNIYEGFTDNTTNQEIIYDNPN